VHPEENSLALEAILSFQIAGPESYQGIIRIKEEQALSRFIAISPHVIGDSEVLELKTLNPELTASFVLI